MILNPQRIFLARFSSPPWKVNRLLTIPVIGPEKHNPRRKELLLYSAFILLSLLIVRLDILSDLLLYLDKIQ